MLKQSGHICKNYQYEVFTDPITQKNFEGEFVPQVYIKRSEHHEYDLEYWHGHFYGEDMQVIRSIRIPKEKQSK